MRARTVTQATHGPRAPGNAQTTPSVVPEARDDLETAARRLRTLGHPLRLELLEALASGPASVTSLTRVLGEKHHLVSKHLSELLRCGVVVRRQEGNFAIYSLPDALTLKAVALIGRSVVDDRKRPARLHDDRRDDPGHDRSIM